MNYRHSIGKIICAIALVLPVVAHAQSAKEVLARLETIYKTGAGVDVAFALADGSKVNMTLAADSNAYHLTTKTEEFISDGKTQWHLFKKDKKVVIDRVKNDGSTVNSQALLDFSKNYEANLVTPSKGNYKLTLTPHANVMPLFKSVGDVKTVVFTLVAKGGGLVVDSISAVAPGGTMTLANLKITPKKKISPWIFTYKPPKYIQVVDLRD